MMTFCSGHAGQEPAGWEAIGREAADSRQREVKRAESQLRFDFASIVWDVFLLASVAGFSVEDFSRKLTIVGDIPWRVSRLLSCANPLLHFSRKWKWFQCQISSTVERSLHS